MGFSSSPAFGPSVAGSRRMVRVTSKHATPELPLLEEAASELAALDEFQLLPASAVDTEGFGAAWTPATAVPQSPEEADEGGSAASDEWPHEPSQGEAETSVGFTQGAVAVEVAAAQVCPQGTPTAETPRLAVTPIGVAGQVPTNSYVPMWCRMVRSADGQTLIAPVADGTLDIEKLPQEQVAQGVANIWCWVQEDPASGNVMVVPCLATQAEVAQQQSPFFPESAVLEAMGASPAPPSPRDSEAAANKAAEKSPLDGPMANKWTGGPQWPFNTPPTTLSIEGLPETMTQEEFIEVLDKEDASGLYDFVFLPARGRPDRKALVNMTTYPHAANLAGRLHGRCRLGGQDAAAAGCQVSWSLPLQGLDALVEAFAGSPENSPDVDEDLRPQLFEGGWPKAMPTGSSRQ